MRLGKEGLWGLRWDWGGASSRKGARLGVHLL